MHLSRSILCAGIALASALAWPLGSAQAATTLSGQSPIVIAHRGASGYLSEHTLGAYELAVKMGADYIEPDLQLSKDGVLVAMHDDTLNRTTNVTELYSARNGGYKVSDFTLAEIKTLSAKPIGGNTYPGFTPASGAPYRIPTFQEVITLAKTLSAQTGREVGIYPEAKQADPVMEDAILATLRSNGYNANSKVYIQSFSDATVRSIDTKQKLTNDDFALVLLGAAVTLPNGTAQMGVLGAGGALSLLSLSEVASFADGIGVVINHAAAPINASFIEQAHAAGLEVHGWTFAQSDATLAQAEYQRYLDMGMDGVFSNYPDLARAAISPVPEPSLALMLSLGGAGVLLMARRQRTARAQPATA